MTAASKVGDMYEVELKVRADHADVSERLGHLGATERDTVIQEDTYYDAPTRDFAETDEALRIRREHPVGVDTWTTTVTYKGPLVESASKTREEIETTVADGEALDAILDRLGFSPAATVEKTREHYQLGEYTVVLDTVEGLGEFVEIEGDAPEEAYEAVRDGAAERLVELGLDPDEQIRTSYLGMLLADA